MATLDLTYTNLMNAVGNLLGYGADYTAYPTARQTECDRVVQSGLRRFYYFRGPVDGVMFTGWSFMRGLGTVTLVAGTRTYDLASDFSDIEFRFTFGDADARPPIDIVGEVNIRDMYNAADADGTPLFAAVKAKTFASTAAQTWEVIFYPEPDAAETISYQYQKNPLQLSGSVLYPLGGPQHASTIEAACMAEAETLVDDEGNGIHEQRFQRLLATSVRLDMHSATPEYLGRNIDRSDYRQTYW